MAERRAFDVRGEGEITELGWSDAKEGREGKEVERGRKERREGTSEKGREGGRKEGEREEGRKDKRIKGRRGVRE